MENGEGKFRVVNAINTGGSSGGGEPYYMKQKTIKNPRQGKTEMIKNRKERGKRGKPCESMVKGVDTQKMGVSERGKSHACRAKHTLGVTDQPGGMKKLSSSRQEKKGGGKIPPLHSG